MKITMMKELVGSETISQFRDPHAVGVGSADGADDLFAGDAGCGRNRRR